MLCPRQVAANDWNGPRGSLPEGRRVAIRRITLLHGKRHLVSLNLLLQISRSMHGGTANVPAPLAGPKLTCY